MGTDHVSGAAHRLQHGFGESLVDLGAQAGNMDVDDIGLGIEMIIPDILQKHGAGDDVTSIAHQIFKQLELAGLEKNRLPGAGDGSRQKIHLAPSR